MSEHEHHRCRTVHEAGQQMQMLERSIDDEPQTLMHFGLMNWRECALDRGNGEVRMNLECRERE